MKIETETRKLSGYRIGWLSTSGQVLFGKKHAPHMLDHLEKEVARIREACPRIEHWIEPVYRKPRPK